ncbi:putative cytosolic phospholipase A2 zeta [Mollisia scopiformis]|uniref:Lysophospholipase n=1 Tax=Mollisia scopiformis TaxID=149040 RepID=A0A194X9I2_MOLSC|nr:putative cytosolic phospholipase A2 zeta [Mollisia scopiformis]KUJ16789.1 putative cytosolic phospholipase A2 zeta [Mollisia scopiformis]
MSRIAITGVTSVVIGAGLTYILYQNNYVQPLPPTRLRSEIRAEREKAYAVEEKKQEIAAENAELLSTLPYQQDKVVAAASSDDSAWGSFTTKFAIFSSITDLQWGAVTDKIVDFVMPDWAKLLPDYISKLQRELSMAPGSLADEIWQEAHDPYINPEIEYSASVRVSSELCDEEKEFLQRRKKVTTTALAKYLGLPEEEVHPEDVPTIAMVGSGGGLRALVAGTGSMLATSEDGLFDCVTYTAGVSGSCWLQSIYHSSLGGRRFDKMVEHLKARIGVHIAYPPVALAALNSAPTNKFLLSGFVEKLKGDPNAEFGLVDVYGLMLAARLLVPKGEVGVDDRDLKISNQREYIERGDHPMPIYTAVRHEIPIIEEASETEKATGSPSEETKTKARKEAWFQWFEISPYEMFCEEFGAGIPTWAIGRKFEGGKDLPYDEDGLRVPELRLPLLLGVFGSAFCATLSHYYREVRPLVKGLVGFGGIDDLIEGRNDDLSKVHPIVPASIPNFAYKMQDRLPETAPESIHKNTHLQLMDAGMSNNLPIYPLLRPGRDVDILIAFDASADIKTDNWLSVADGYARQRGIKGWPIGVGWPKQSDTAEKTAGQLDEAQASTAAEADSKLEEAKADQASNSQDDDDSGDLGYCTVWVGTTQERASSTENVKSKAVKEDWQLMQPDAGIAVVYFPFLSNPKVEGVDPMTSDYMSTWNFVYTPEDIDNVVALARANYEEGREQTRRCVRAVYERKRKKREERENAERELRWRRKVRLGIVGKKGEGDHFHLT